MNLLELLKLEDKFSIDEIEEKLDIFRKYQHYFYIGLVFIVIVQIIFSLTIPSFQFYRTDSKSFNQYSKILTLRKKQVANKENLQKELDQLNKQLEEKKRAFFTEKEVEEFSISTLPKIAEQYNLKISSITFVKPQVDVKGIMKHPVNLEIETGFYDLMSFFYELEQSRKGISINTVRIRRKSIDPLELAVSVTLDLFSLKSKS